MSHTNSTPNYNLPQFLTTDKPFWLTDINGAFSAIDTGIDAAKDAADNAQNDATQALTDAGTAISASSTADAKASGALASLADAYDATSTYSVGDLVIYNSLLYKNTTAIITPEAWDGSHWTRVTVEDNIDLKQDITDNSLQTTDKTVVGAINELRASMTYNAGDAIGISNAQLAGILTTSQTQIIIQIPVLKPISASTVTLNPNSLWSIRHVSGGYIISNAKLSTIGSYSVVKNGIGLVVTIELNNTFTGAPNNSPVVASLSIDDNNIINFS